MATKDVKARLTWDGVSKFTIDTKKVGEQIERAFSTGKRKVNEFQAAGQRAISNLKAGFSALNAVLGPVGLSLGIGAAVFGMRQLINETISYRDSIGKASDATGVSVEFLSAVGFAAEQSGSSLQGFQTGLRGLLRNMQGVKDGLQQSRDAFSNLGVEVLTQDGTLRAAEDVFVDVAEAIKGMSNETEAAAVAQEIFGRSGIELVPLLKAGKEGIAAYKEEAQDLNRVLTEEQTKAAAEAADAINRFDSAITGLSQNLSSSALPAITVLANVLSKIISDINNNEGVLSRFRAANEMMVKVFTTLNPLVRLYVAQINDATDALKNAPPEMPFVSGVEELEDLLPPMERLIEDIPKITPGVSPLPPIIRDAVDKVEELRQEFDSLANDELIDINEQLRIYNEQEMEAAKSNVEQIAQFFAGTANQVSNAVIEGEKFVVTLQKMAKELGKRVFAGLIGGALTFVASGFNPLGFKTGFQFASGFRNFQSGGSPPIGQPVRVGERGPEDVIFNRPVQIRPAHESARREGDLTLQVNVTTRKLDMEELDFVLIPRLRRLLIERFGVSSI